MLGSAVIIFREVLEAALIIGLILAVTRGVPGRMRFVIMGLAAGLSGAVLLALFGDWLAPLAEGMGQELLNAGILMTAVVMLTWHLVWMKKHSRSISHNIKQIGSKIEAGEQETSIIAVIIGLAILREGSEAVIFMFGLSAAGSSFASLLTGSLLGLFAGIAAGVVVYYSLARVPLTKLFRISGWLILLLTAGLAAQASNYLVQADILPALGNQVWDTSHILSEKSLFGQFLHIIIGYVAQPMGIQIIFYVTTLIVVSGLTYLVANPLSRNSIRVATISVVSVFFGALFMFSGNEVHASHKIYSPHVEEGEAELELRTHTTFDNNANKDSKEKTKLEAGYGVTERWFTGIGAVYSENSNGDQKYKETFWENIIQLTEQGEHWVDVGLYLEYVLSNETGGNDKVEGKLLLEKAVGRYVNTANLVFARHIGSGASTATDFEYAWRTKYIMSKSFEIGVELYGETGEVGRPLPSAQQDHRIGPVLSGVLANTAKGKWVYELGYLFGISNAAPDGTLKLNLEYEFRF